MDILKFQGHVLNNYIQCKLCKLSRLHKLDILHAQFMNSTLRPMRVVNGEIRSETPKQHSSQSPSYSSSLVTSGSFTLLDSILWLGWINQHPPLSAMLFSSFVNP